MVYSALTHGLREDLDFTPRFGDQGDGSRPHGPNWLTLSADVSTDGTIIAKSSYYIDPDVLTQVIAEVLSSSEESGHDANLHLSWMRTQNHTGWRISIVDTQSVDAALARQTATDVVIVLVAMAVLFAIVWVLSAWMMTHPKVVGLSAALCVRCIARTQDPTCRHPCQHSDTARRPPNARGDPHMGREHKRQGKSHEGARGGLAHAGPHGQGAGRRCQARPCL